MLLPRLSRSVAKRHLVTAASLSFVSWCRKKEDWMENSNRNWNEETGNGVFLYGNESSVMASVTRWNPGHNWSSEVYGEKLLVTFGRVTLIHQVSQSSAWLILALDWLLISFKFKCVCVCILTPTLGLLTVEIYWTGKVLFLEPLLCGGDVVGFWQASRPWWNLVTSCHQVSCC